MTPGAPKATLGAKVRFWTFSERLNKILGVFFGSSWGTFGELVGDFGESKSVLEDEQVKK